MFKRILLFFVLLCFFSCKETVFNAGLENRVTAVIDFAPELYNQKIDFTSDDQVENCDNSDVFYVDQIADGSIDNKIFKLTLDARDFLKVRIIVISMIGILQPMKKWIMNYRLLLL